jgi:hypothetical protein
MASKGFLSALNFYRRERQMVVCNRCDHEIQYGDEYKIAYNQIWCIECADEIDEDDGSFGMTYIRSEGVGDAKK